MRQADIRNFEIQQLLDTIYFRYGYDFRDYASASLERKVLNRVKQSQLSSISELNSRILHDPRIFNTFLKDMSVTVTEMFRDPYVFKQIRQAIFQSLQTYSRVNIWHVGCATGEEAYSMAIMLHEEGLLKRTRIYATDYNNHSLDRAQTGSYPIDKLEQYNQNYLAAGGKCSLKNYCQKEHNDFKFNNFLKDHITFANHNLMKDQVFAQMHLILCRNVLIYFNSTMQSKVIKLLKESLVHRGFLVLGDQESLDFNDEKQAFEYFSKKENIYRCTLNL